MCESHVLHMCGAFISTTKKVQTFHVFQSLLTFTSHSAFLLPFTHIFGLFSFLSPPGCLGIWFSVARETERVMPSFILSLMFFQIISLIFN